MLIDLLLGAAALLLLIPVLVIAVQVVFACLRPPHKVALAQAPVKIAVLVPAHNEAEGISATINSILPQLNAGDRLLVVADNCSDRTAQSALDCGAEVIERHDPQHRGKGYALDCGIRFLAQEPPDVVLIIDADCSVSENALHPLALLSALHKRPVQGLYLMYSAPGAGLKAKIAEFAWLVKNLVRPLGNAKLGLPCPLMGSGMAFPWELISQANLANGNIVEDMKLGIDLCKAGKPPLFYADALVTSHFPTTASALSAQRTRWEHGHLGMILSEAPRLLWQACATRNTGLLGMALDLCVPPLALLVVMLSVFLILAGCAAWAGAASLPFLLAAGSLALLALAISLAWWMWGRHIISLLSFLSIPVYVLSKIPCYFNFLFNRQKKWVRTERE